MEEDGPLIKDESHCSVEDQTKDLIITELAEQLKILKLKHEQNLQICQQAIDLARKKKQELDNLQTQYDFLVERLEECKQNH